ncbi:MAG: squalene/phytoene synthase family protein, partial [Candidatus Thermoplasmatota archaeon]|nr:squalene/phytoene synthase family protein [Candidatus Thermoplasmatota archaeon]
MVQSINIDNPELILATSGESFHWARRFLGNKMGHDAARLYSFCRVLDDMADGDIENGPQHLIQIQEKLKQGEWGSHPLLDQFSDMVNEYGLSTNVVSSLVEGLLDDQSDEVLIADEE